VDWAQLVLDYIRVLIWPALVVVLAIHFRRGIGDFLGRIAGESQEFSASASGFGVGFTAKFQKQLETLAEQSETAGATELKESVQRVAKEFNRDQFRALTANFTDLSTAQRQQAVRELARLTESMELGEILGFTHSPHAGERVGAAVALGALLERSAEAADDQAVIEAIQRLLADRSSFVRYRAVEALLGSPTLTSHFESELRRLARTERNSQVRALARRALERAGI
jgi:HEAT repeat protein